MVEKSLSYVRVSEFQPTQPKFASESTEFLDNIYYGYKNTKVYVQI